MTVADFDDESNFLEGEIRAHNPRQLRMLYIIIAILVLTAAASFLLGILAQKSTEVTGAGNADASAGSGGVVSSGHGSDSSLNALSVPTN